MPNRPRLWDAKKTEQEYVTSTLSVRELARRNGVSYSSMAKHARDNDWNGKRVAYQAALSRRGYEAMAAELASQEGIIREESVLVMRATLRKYAERLAAGDVAVSTKDAVEAVRTIAYLLGEPNSGQRGATDARSVNKPDADHLRRVAEVARKQLSEYVVVEGTAHPGEQGTRPN